MCISFTCLVTGVLAQLFPAMDSSAWRNVTRWLSSHLTNTKLAWPFWDSWANEYAESADDAVHKAFMNLLVEQCTSALSAQRLQSALPESIHCAIVSDFTPACTEMFSADAVADSPLAGVARALLEKIDDRVDPDDLQEWLEEPHDGVDDALQVRRNVY